MEIWMGAGTAGTGHLRLAKPVPKYFLPRYHYSLSITSLPELIKALTLMLMERAPACRLEFSTRV